MARSDVLTLDRKKIDLYSDFLDSFEVNPFTGSLARTTNEDAVRQSLCNLLKTSQGERLYSSRTGSRVRNALFEPFDLINMDLLKDSIHTTLGQEPRAIIRRVQLGPVEYAEQEGFARYNPQTELDMDGINITVEYSVVNIPDQVFNLAVTITRVR